MDPSIFLDAFDRRAKRREERRELFRVAGGFTAGAAGALALTSFGAMGSSAEAQTTAPSDSDILNFALNLEYVESQFFSFAATGAGLPASMMTGTGTQGTVLGGQKATFSNPIVASFANEIAKDESTHVAFLRSQLGGSAIAMPTVDISVTPTSAFSVAAQKAGTVLPGQAFNPYANDENWLLAAYLFEDVGVTAYNGAAPLLSSKTYLSAAAGIMAVEAYHAGFIRTMLYTLGIETPTLSPNPITATQQISAARATLDGTGNDDQGVVMVGSPTTSSNIVNANANALAYARTTAQVLNIDYLTTAATTMGGFFPNGVNGAINMSG